MSQWPTWLRYGIGAGAGLVAALLTLVGQPFLAQAVFLVFWPAVLATAVFVGFGPAILTSVLGVIVADRLFLAPARATALPAADDVLPIVIFLLAAAIASRLADRVRAAERAAVASAAENARLAEQLRDQAAELEQQAIELESQLEESQTLQEEIEQTANELAERTEEAQAAADFSRGIVDAISDPFVVQDAEWRFRYVNEAASRAFSRSGHGGADGVLGRVVWEAYPDIVGSPFEREMRRAAAERKPTTVEALYPRTGLWSQIFCYPLADGGLAVQWKDVTARRRAEEATRYLTRTTELLNATLDYQTRLANLAQLIVPELADWCAVHLARPDGKPQQVAVAHVDGAKVKWAFELQRRYPPPSDAPTGVPNVLRTGQPELYSEITDDALAATAVDDEHLRLTRELGLFSAMIVPLPIRGRTIGALTLISAESRRRYDDGDLSLAMELGRRAAISVDNARQHEEALAARQSAEEANAAKSRFLAAMSHELRTPLNAIAGYAELLDVGIHGTLNDAQRQAIQRIQRSQHHLLSLINDILNFARLEAGRVEYRLADVPMRELLAELESFVAPQLAQRGVAFDCDRDSELTVRADREKVLQILLNLLSNAIKFTNAGGEVRVRCGSTERTVSIAVDDTGIGIPADRLDAIFEPFVQVHRTLAEPTEGTGLGLAISRDLARGMEGDLTVESAPGKGSSFTLTLPRA